MKTNILTIACTIISFMGFSQDNNPYSKRGADYITSLNIISTDFNAGKVKEINPESLNKYSRLIPLQNQISVDMAAVIVKTIKAPGYSLAGLVKKSSFSVYVKETALQLLNVNKISPDQFLEFLSKKTDEIKSAMINEQEKEMLLTLVAISYHSSTSLAGRRNGCYVETNTYSGPVPHETCISAAATAGFFIALPICGILCGLGGAIIGGVAAALS